MSRYNPTHKRCGLELVMQQAYSDYIFAGQRRLINLGKVWVKTGTKPPIRDLREEREAFNRKILEELITVTGR